MKKIQQREIKYLSEINSEKIVKLFNVWIDKNEFINIQMELCDYNLKDFLVAKMKGFKRKYDQPINDLEYFISHFILEEICEGLKYLHGLKPKIIHRDLKPENVLVTKSSTGNFIKLCDFGLSIEHESNKSNHSEGVGTNIYIAPEVLGNRKYNEKVDVFSLAVMAFEIIGYNIRKGINKYAHDDYYKRLVILKIFKYYFTFELFFENISENYGKCGLMNIMKKIIREPILILISKDSSI